MTSRTATAAPPYFSAQTEGEAEPIFNWAGMMSEPSPASRWTVPEAFFAVLFSAAAADAAIDALEQETLIAIGHRSRTLKGMDQKALIALNEAVVRKLHADGEEALPRACEALPNAARLPAFAHALDIMLSDGALTPAEAAMLNALAAYMRLAEPDVRRVAEVLILKSRV